jgi:hypothetical protein
MAAFLSSASAASAAAGPLSAREGGGVGSPGLPAGSGSTDSPTLRALAGLPDLVAGRMRGSSMTASAGGGSLSIVMRGAGFRVPVNWSRALLSPNGQYAVCGGDRGVIYSFSAETGALEAEIGLGEGERSAVGRRGREASGTGFALGTSAAAAGGGLLHRASFSGGGSAPSPLSGLSSGGGGGGAGDTGPHEGAAIFGLDYSGYLMATGDDKGKVVVWADG